MIRDSNSKHKPNNYKQTKTHTYQQNSAKHNSDILTHTKFTYVPLKRNFFKTKMNFKRR